jgi:hypothetical protein
MAAMVEVGLCGVGPAGKSPRMAVPDEFSADEIRAALMLTRRAADTQFWLAYDLVSRLPAVHAAVADGVLDEPRSGVLGSPPPAGTSTRWPRRPNAPVTAGRSIISVPSFCSA